MQQITIPPLAKGETYIGAIGDKDGDVYHVILLPGDNDDSDWQAALDWAKSIGGELPTRREQSLLFANAKDAFHPDWYWSGELYASDASYAWCQTFRGGYQDGSHLGDSCRARAVRRLIIE